MLAQMNGRSVVILGTLALVVIVLSHGGRAQSPKSLSPDSNHETLTMALEKHALQAFFVPDTQRVIWKAMIHRAGWQLFVDGKPIGAEATQISDPLVSRDLRHVAYGVLRKGAAFVVLDGDEFALPPETLMPRLEFSDDGRALVYSACRFTDAKQIRCRTEIVGQSSNVEIDQWPVLVSGGDHPSLVAYPARRDDRIVLVFNGKDTPESVAGHFTLRGPKKGYVPFAGMTRSPATSRFAYVAWGDFPLARAKRDLAQGIVLKNTVAAVIDGQVGEPFSLLGPIVFSPDGKRVAYAAIDFEGSSWAYDRGTWQGCVIVDGAAGPVFEYKGAAPLKPVLAAGDLPLVLHGLDPSWAGVSNPVFSPDSKHVAYVARKGKSDFLVMLDGAPLGSEPMERVLGGPVFSPDGAHLAYVGLTRKEATLYLDGKASGTVAGAAASGCAEAITFSPDNRHVAFILASEAPQVKPPMMFDYPFTSYNLDSERIAYMRGLETEQKSQRRFVLDGAAGPAFDSVRIEAIRFSPNGQHSAFIVRGGGGFSGSKSFVIRNGQPGKTYTQVFLTSLTLSDDGVAAYVALDDRGIFKVTQGEHQ